MERKERADAARNRAAILRAAEELLREHGPDHVSVELVAQAAGVGKGTVFHRFGSRSGLMRALIEERVQVLRDAFTSGPPPLGPGAAARDRLAAFFDAVLDLATRNVALMAAYERAEDGERQAGIVYQTWHHHVSTLIAECRPDFDADLLAHILLGSLHTDLVVHLVRQGESARLAATVRQLVTALVG
ncbi:MAG TPA: TetR/AcrR family transcriptional regulator [Pseudonocardiaceae bacterium]|jgi:AcrR family transcriptional regulator|nr:TetR/AcrR family transcriptional regulator [Pseudonocardiaceae bacterium]